MRRLLVLAASATMLACIATGSATAGSFRYDRLFIVGGFPRVNFAGGFGTVECPLTLEGARHVGTALKLAGNLAGFFEEARLGTCTRGSATILTASLPWHYRYASFTGTLPNITSLNYTLVGMQLQIREPTFGVTCLASGGIATMRFNREAGGNLTTFVLGGSSPTNCGISGTLSGTSNSLSTPAFLIRVTLI
jgi:hypothetical protein